MDHNQSGIRATAHPLDGAPLAILSGAIGLGHGREIGTFSLSFPKRGETVLRRHLPFNKAGHLIWGGRESAKFRGDTDQETHDTNLEQVPLREA